MLSLLKRKSEGAGGLEMPAWHPNLRNAAKLPDTKVVRTSFFVNGVATFIAVACLVWFSYQEYQLHDLNRQIDEAQAQIDHNKPESDRFIAMYRKFEAEQAKINEVNEFVRSRPPVSEMLMYVGETIPSDIALDSYEQTLAGLALRGTVRGTPDEATGYATSYLEQLRADSVMTANFSEIAFSGSGVSRNAQTGSLTLQLYLKFGPAPKGVKK